MQCCARKSRAACAQSFAPWQQATIEIMLAISLTIACSRYVYYGVILHAHPVRGESHNERNTTGEVATAEYLKLQENHQLTLNAPASFLQPAKMSNLSHWSHISPMWRNHVSTWA